MRRTAGLIGAALVLVASAGCAASAPEPTPTSDPNRASCWGFREETRDLLAQFTSGAKIDTAEVLAAIDRHALNATGDVKMRMLAFLDELPSGGEMLVYPSAREDYNALAEAVGRACEASGSSVELTLFVTD